jgi:hypothetical protein
LHLHLSAFVFAMAFALISILLLDRYLAPTQTCHFDRSCSQPHREQRSGETRFSTHAVNPIQSPRRRFLACHHRREISPSRVPRKKTTTINKPHLPHVSPQPNHQNTTSTTQFPQKPAAKN